MFGDPKTSAPVQLNLCLTLVRLNKITSVVPDEPDLLRHVTQLDLRDNRLTELDACVFPKLEVLHCERNRIVCLKAKGSFLKGIYASSNGGFFPTGDICGWERRICYPLIITASLISDVIS